MQNESTNRPRDKGQKGKDFISDEEDDLFFSAHDVSKFRPEKGISFFQYLCADGFCPVSYTLGYYILALQAGKTFAHWLV